MLNSRVSRREIMVCAAGTAAAGLTCISPRATLAEATDGSPPQISGWPEHPKAVAGYMIEKYGQPLEHTGSRLIWSGNKPWKWSVLFAEEVQHLFPTPHPDVLEQAIRYKVPQEKCSDLAKFNGAIIVRITKGELSAQCHKEEHNFLAINLAHEIISNMRTVENARKFQTETLKALQAGEKHPYTQGFVFELPVGDTAFPDAVAKS
jgi:hypothetical protein